MFKFQSILIAAAVSIVAAAIVAVQVSRVYAHCDSVHGPIIPEAQKALETGEIVSLFKWIRPEYEPEVEIAFNKALLVRALGSEAKELADRFFLETLVRLHRAGEGAAFTGINDEPLEPIITLADQALADNNVEALIESLTQHMAQVIREKFKNVIETGKAKDNSVAAGREYVEAYVNYMHTIERIHAAILLTGAHDPDRSESAGHEH